MWHCSKVKWHSLSVQIYLYASCTHVSIAVFSISLFHLYSLLEYRCHLSQIHSTINDSSPLINVIFKGLSSATVSCQLNGLNDSDLIFNSFFLLFWTFFHCSYSTKQWRFWKIWKTDWADHYLGAFSCSHRFDRYLKNSVPSFTDTVNFIWHIVQMCWGFFQWYFYAQSFLFIDLICGKCCYVKASVIKTK